MRNIKKLLISLISLCVSGFVLATPTRIVDLTIVSATSGPTTGVPVALSFSMPAPGAGLTLAEIDCRKSVGVAISTLNWGTRERILPSPGIVAPGTRVFVNTVMPYDQATYFACRARDTAWSLLSNLVSTSVTTPAYRNAILEWTPAVHPELSGYRIYWRMKSGQVFDLSRTKTIGLGSTAVVPVPWGNEHCFVMKSLSPTSESANFSNEACTVWGYLL